MGRSTIDSQSTNDPERRRRRAWVVIVLGAIVIGVAAAFVIWPLLTALTPDEPSVPISAPPAGTQPALPTPTTPNATDRPSPIPTASPRRSTASGRVGDYRCVTLIDASTAIERDGYVVGTVSYSIEGGAVGPDWLVDVQRPLPGGAASAGHPIDLLLASPFNTCQPTSPLP